MSAEPRRARLPRRGVAVMSMGPAEVGRKVRPLDNDVHSLYEPIFNIQSTQTRHTNRFNELAEQVDARFAAVDVRLTAVDVKLDAGAGAAARPLTVVSPRPAPARWRSG